MTDDRTIAKAALRALFLVHLRLLRRVDLALAASGWNERAAYRDRKLLPDFAAAWESAEAVRPRFARNPKRRQAFLNTLAEIGNASAAARMCGVPMPTVKDLRLSDPTFAAAWQVALDDAIEAAFGRLLEGAITGFVRTATVNGVEKRIVEHQPRVVLDMLAKYQVRREQDRGQMIELTPALATAARARLLDQLASGARLRSMGEAVVAMAALPEPPNAR